MRTSESDTVLVEIDIVQHSVAAFLAHKHIPSSDKDVALVKELFEKYICFDDSGTAFSGGSYKGEGARARGAMGPERGGYKRYSDTTRSTAGCSPGTASRIPPMRRNRQLGFEDKLKREVQSLLNKMTTQNNERIIEKILRITDAKNLLLVVDVIFDKCYSQDAFICNYTNILIQLHKTFPLQETSFFEQVLKFHDVFRCDLWKLHVENDILTTNSDDEYCRFVKSKRYLYGKHRVLLSLIDQIDTIPINLHLYFEMLIEFMLKVCTNDPMYEIAITLVKEFSHVFPDEHEKIELFSKLFDQHIKEKVSFKKILFLVKDFEAAN